MDTARRVIGILLVVGMPPAIAFWLVIHPFARWWRRVDVRVTYALLAVLMTGFGVLLFAFRGPLRGRDLDTNWWLVCIGGVLYLASVAVSLLCRTQLSMKTFAGVPEVSRAAFPGQLLQDGIYGVIRHPRYLSVILGTVGLALIVNYLGAYIVVVVSLIGLWPLIILEERELISRFGPAYTAYRSRLPALVPRFRRTRTETQL
jgi:protein-S-isoprenylcysteine O-methyltransferase Ste14